MCSADVTWAGIFCLRAVCIRMWCKTNPSFTASNKKLTRKIKTQNVQMKTPDLIHKTNLLTKTKKGHFPVQKNKKGGTLNNPLLSAATGIRRMGLGESWQKVRFYLEFLGGLFCQPAYFLFQIRILVEGSTEWVWVRDMMIMMVFPEVRQSCCQWFLGSRGVRFICF